MVLLDEKICNKCKVNYTIDSTNFHRDNSKKDGFSTLCKQCKNEYRKRNKLKIAEYQKEYSKFYYNKNKELIIKRSEVYYRENREHVLKRTNKYYDSNRNDILKRQRLYIKNNRDKVLASKKRSYENNLDKYRSWRLERKARILSLPNDFNANDRKSLLSEFDGSCCLTGSKDIHMDHVIPLNRGGGTVVGNIIPLNSKLNRSKSDRNLFEWFDIYKNEYNLSESRFNALIEFLANQNKMSIERYVDYYNETYNNHVKGEIKC